MLTILILLLQILLVCAVLAPVLRIVVYILAALGIVIAGDIWRIIGAICLIVALLWFLEALSTHTTHILI